jgi:hypothetical protein
MKPSIGTKLLLATAAAVAFLSAAILPTAGALTLVNLATQTQGVLPASQGGAGTVSGILRANGSGTVAAVTIGSGLTYSSGTLSASGGGGSPGGASGTVQYNNAGAFGGITGSSVSGGQLTLGDVFSLAMNGNTWAWQDNGSSTLVLSTNGTGNHKFGVDRFNLATHVPAAGGYGWTPGSDITVGMDTQLSRTAAKVVEVNSGTAGAYPGTALVLGAQTFAQLPTCGSTTKGARATVTDATATTFLTAIAGSGSNVVPAFCDGTSWKIG